LQGAAVTSTPGAGVSSTGMVGDAWSARMMLIVLFARFAVYTRFSPAS
jgi:hypothetical protein